MQRFGLTFSSEAKFRVPVSGVVELSRQAPLSGSYTRVDAMGLFWSAVPTAAAPKPYQTTRDSELTPRPFTIAASSDGTTVVAGGVRFVQADTVVRQVVDSSGMVATLFRPSSSGCHPGVIVLGGSEGGVPEEQAAVLASHNLTTLALAYFGAPGLPSSLTEIPIETVERALSFMRDQPSVCPHDAALFGGSKGAELALLSASIFGGVRAVGRSNPRRSSSSAYSVRRKIISRHGRIAESPYRLPTDQCRAPSNRRSPQKRLLIRKPPMSTTIWLGSKTIPIRPQSFRSNGSRPLSYSSQAMRTGYGPPLSWHSRLCNGANQCHRASPIGC